MATSDEIKKERSETLFDLMMIERSKDIGEALKDKIARTKTSMSKEEVALVEKLVQERRPQN